MLLDVRQSTEFETWLAGLADDRARKRIVQRIERLRMGLFGDTKPVGGRVMELRIDHGPGYRVYYLRHGREIVLLLCGGDKRSQPRDISRARELAEQWRN